MAKTRQRIPKLRFTALRNFGWHVSYRDKETDLPKKHLFNIHEREREAEARVLYHGWVLEHLGANQRTYPTQVKKPPRPTKRPDMLSGCVLEVATGLKKAEEARVRAAGEPRRQGSITAPVFRYRVKVIHDFLEFLNERHTDRGTDTAKRLADPQDARSRRPPRQDDDLAWRRTRSGSQRLGGYSRRTDCRRRL